MGFFFCLGVGFGFKALVLEAGEGVGDVWGFASHGWFFCGEALVLRFGFRAGCLAGGALLSMAAGRAVPAFPGAATFRVHPRTTINPLFAAGLCG